MSEQTVPEDAIIAGAKAMDAYWGGRYAPDEVEELRGEVTAILEAAAPHILAKVEVIAERLTKSNQCEDREIADDLRAAIGGVK